MSFKHGDTAVLVRRIPHLENFTVNRRNDAFLTLIKWNSTDESIYLKIVIKIFDF